ncbi:MAG: methylmalonyl-CoA mutase [Hyphomicrobiaceae bacterium]|nr:methylmalonyl-CoA mutase [Hyphomicrobiaceae bacterium]
MSDPVSATALAADFPKADRETWMRLVEKALKGGDFEKRMVSHTADGLRIAPLYTLTDALPHADTAAPGNPPFVRGLKSSQEGLGWGIEQVVVGDTPEAANAAALAELEGGASGVVLRLAAPGQVGIPSAGTANMKRILEGIYLDYASVALDAGLDAVRAANDLAAAVGEIVADPASVRLRFDLDPIGTLAQTGHCLRPAAEAVAEAVTTSAGLKSRYPASRGIRVDGRVAHEAGGSEGQELAVTAASLVAYLRAFDKAGVTPADAFAQITVTLSADADLFLVVAKLRAARRLIARIAEASGAADAAAHVHLAVTSSARMMTQRDPWTNMLRTTAATLGATFGGADAITVLPYTWALGKPDAFAYRIARNSQIVAQEESSLGRVTDPAGGSWYVEKLTADLAATAWQRFQAIEAEGGILASLASGTIQRDIAATAAARDKAIATGKQPLTGTSTFPLLGDDGITAQPWPEPPALAGEGLVAPMAPHRLAAPFEELRDAADHTTSRTGHAPTVFLASLGTIADHTARTTWVKNQLAVAGIASIVSDGFASPDEAAAAFRDAGATAACICSSDAIYAEQAAKTAKALTEAGAEHVLLAGRPGDLEAELRAAGIERFLYAGQNAVEVLTELQHQLTG